MPPKSPATVKHPNTHKPFSYHPVASAKAWPRWLRVAIPIASIAVIALGTYIAIKIAKGYRPTTKGLQGTGLLAANSFPSGAQVFINGNLTTATDQTINLTPGDYDVAIKKDGFITWQKRLKLQAEIVTQTNATLFPAVSSLSPITLSGATNITPSPDGTKLAFVVASASADIKNGLYILDLATSPIPFTRSPRFIATSTPDLNFTKATLLWSPSSTQILAHFTKATYLLDADKLNPLNNQTDTTASLPTLLSDWEEEIVVRETKQFSLLPGELKQIATESAKNVYFSPNEERVMYTSTGYATLPQHLAPSLMGSNSQPEERSLVPSGIYLYDIKEDKNFRIDTEKIYSQKLPPPPVKDLLLLFSYQQSTSSAAIKSPIPFKKLQDPRSTIATIYNFKTHYSPVYVSHLQWFPNSSHVLIRTDHSIDIAEYDNTNHATLYAGPFLDNFLYPWPDGSKLVVLTNLNASSDIPGNLYSIGLK